jgi:hypothetical protein
VPVLQQRRNLSLARGKYRIGVRISISFVLYGAMDACGADRAEFSCTVCADG